MTSKAEIPDITPVIMLLDGENLDGPWEDRVYSRMDCTSYTGVFEVICRRATPRAVPAPGHHRSNTTLKSFCMLTTVQPRSFALASAFSEPAS